MSLRILYLLDADAHDHNDVVLEALDAQLVLGAFELAPVLLLRNSAIRMLTQPPQGILEERWGMLAEYGIEQWFVCQEDLDGQHIEPRQLPANCQVLASGTLPDFLRQFDAVLGAKT